MPNVLIVASDHKRLAPLNRYIKEQDRVLFTAGSAEEAEEIQERERVDLFIVSEDIGLTEALSLVRRLEDEVATDVVFLADNASVDSAVEALRAGASDYLSMPIEMDRVASILRRAVRSRHLKARADELDWELRTLGRFGRLVGRSACMHELYDLIGRVAPTDSPVLITGETGVGKELVARTLHERSRRSRSTYLPVNCAAIPDNLIESELFGHVKGSFTGADRPHDGYFQRAHKGTLFLDEITEMPSSLQAKLLRVLESNRFTPVGGSEPREVDVRIVSATNRDPKEAIASGKLREDLFFRLAVFPLAVPALRERPGDVPLLAEHFLDNLNRSRDGDKKFSREVLDLLERQPWRGNVRELKNAVERAYVLSGDVIEPGAFTLQSPPSETASSSGSIGDLVGLPLKDIERQVIMLTLERYGGDKKKAAEVLGVSLKTIYNRLKEYEDAE